MSAADDHQALELAYRAALAARRETFLARYPRWLKIACVLLLLGGMVAPFLSGSAEPLTEPAASPESDHAAPQAEDGPAPHAATEAPQAGREEGHPPAEEAHASAQKVPEPEALLPGQQKLERGPEGEVIAPHQPPAPSGQPPRSDAERQAMARNDAAAPFQRMPIAPDAELAEASGDGYLPRIAPDGRKPWQVYARPFDFLDPRPRIALVMVDMGLSRVATDAALRRLPPAVTLAFDSQSDTLAAWLGRARQDGHETLLTLPMEPLDYPRSDPGPDALLTTLPNADNIQRFLSQLKRGVGYVGVTTLTGSRFASDMGKLLPVMTTLRERGLLALDTRVATHSVVREVALQVDVPVAVSQLTLDATPTPQAIDEALTRLEQLARINGRAVALASPLPLTVEKLEGWTRKLAERGFVLAPLSAVVEH